VQPFESLSFQEQEALLAYDRELLSDFCPGAEEAEQVLKKQHLKLVSD
jgi:hypothetical protein